MGVRRGACWELLIGCGCCYPSRDWTIRKSCCWKQNPLNCETAAEYTGLCVRQKQACMYAAYETLHTCSFILYLPVIQSNNEHTRAQIHSWFGVSVRVRTNGVCVKHAWMNSLQRRSLFSVANRSVAARAKKHNLTLLSRTWAMLFIMLLYPNSCRVMKHNLKMPNGTQRNKFCYS